MSVLASHLRFPKGFVIDGDRVFTRTLEIIPGVLIWGTFLALGVLGVVAPRLIAVFLIVYSLYWFIRAIYIGVHLVASYRTLRHTATVNWLERLEMIDHAESAVPALEKRIAALRHEATAAVETWRERRRLTRVLGVEERFLADLRRLVGVSHDQRPRWSEILHVVILPTYREPLALLRQSLDALAAVAYPKDRLWVVVALEERAGPQVSETARRLEEQYAEKFGRFFTTIHPDGIAGERRVKSANATWAVRVIQRLLDDAHIPYEQVLVSNFDADTVVSKGYFGALSAAFLLQPDRLRCSYQPLPVYHNNIWDAPAFTRVIATNSTFWLLIECTRPERLVTYSSHAMTLRALVDAGFWDPTVVSEDSRIFWQCYLRYHGDYRTVPLYVTVSMDATQAPTLLQTVVSQYKQKRRWAWGIENFPYLARAFLQNRLIARRERLRHILIMLEAWHSWATAALILAVLGWIPIFFGGADFQQTVLAFNLPRVSRTLLTLASAGLFVNMSLSLAMLPPPPPGTPKRKYVWMTLQWVLVPLIAWTLGTVPVLDAVTRMMFGRYLGFWVTPKHRALSAAPIRVMASVARVEAFRH